MNLNIVTLFLFAVMPNIRFTKRGGGGGGGGRGALGGGGGTRPRMPAALPQLQLPQQHQVQEEFPWDFPPPPPPQALARQAMVQLDDAAAEALVGAAAELPRAAAAARALMEEELPDVQVTYHFIVWKRIFKFNAVILHL